jgi:hypothetical protein
MRNWTKAALLSAGVIGALAAGGCAGRYDDDYYGRSYYDDNGYRHHDRDRDSYRGHDRDWNDRSNRVRVCDADGDDCHYEYERH